MIYEWLCWLNNNMRLKSTLLNILFTLVFCPLLSTSLRCPRPICWLYILTAMFEGLLEIIFRGVVFMLSIQQACYYASGCACESTYFYIRWPGVTSEKLSEMWKRNPMNGYIIAPRLKISDRKKALEDNRRTVVIKTKS